MKNKGNKNGVVVTKNVFMEQLLEMLVQCLYYYDTIPTYNDWIRGDKRNKNFLGEQEFNMLRLLAASTYGKDITEFYNNIMKNKIHKNHLIKIKV